MRTRSASSRTRAAAVAALIVGGAAATAPSAAAALCPTGWGSTPEQVDLGGPDEVAAVVGVRAGQHACFDRFVLDFAGPVPDTTVRYVPAGDPEALDVGGGAALRIQVEDATWSEMEDVSGVAARVGGFRTFRDATPMLFEHDPDDEVDDVLYVLGTRARLPFRVLALDGPGDHDQRLVVDVAHSW
ncbi:hypothetical protein [Quadrisphaera sp. DSM 44207]|uniref:AMIN-like domain-containing (lipo)protein n=1 Tax=Quadrisphaera sp. DSM 44207 TaxID=1881057 RepID=UPI000891DEC4|nr:hypothetical protein [Quadrisphaera sp. DSM 44207]SDQ86940.1 hypothetical protein SAMN05428996_2963 [Quadrisphaera sp. DSM 44207]